MPLRDGTGPMGRGAMSGRGLGVCIGVNAARYGAGLEPGLGLGLGFGCRRGFGRNFVANQTIYKTQRELLTEQQELLQIRLNMISKRLESLSETTK